MKFNPKLNSVILALNLPSQRQDVERIRQFYNGPIIHLRGLWKGNEERSYQLSMNELDVALMEDELLAQDQEAIVVLSSVGDAFLATPDCSFFSLKYLGKMTQIMDEAPSCTKCISTNTYWKAL